ncbi:MAG: rhomboid family intramembrane serine protease [Candidatus Nanoarchaeia archaeon]
MEEKIKNQKFQLRNIAFTIIGLNIVMFILQQIIPGMTEKLLLDASRVWSEPWLLLTSMFLHADIWHLFFNMYALLIFGTLIEQRIGSKRFLWAYLLAGIIAAAGATFFYPKALGASGAIMAILGLTIMLMPDLKVLFFFVIPMSMRTAGIIFAIIDIIGIMMPMGIANIAHLIGLVCGLLYGWYLIRKKKSTIEKVLGVQYYESRDPIKKKNSKTSRVKKKDTIELSDEDIEEYISKGRL